MTDPMDIVTGDAPAQPPCWRLPQQEPVNLLAPVPGADAPSLDTVARALATALGESIDVAEREVEEGTGLAWLALVEVPGLPGPIALWVERLAAPIETCTWAVGIETLLHPDDPLTHFLNLLRLLGAALPIAPCVIDVNTGLHHPQEMLHELAGGGVDPPEDVLWVIHAVGTDEERADDAVVWLHTHGMWRCGRPEFEIVDVPESWAGAAAALLNAVAALSLEGPLAGAGIAAGDRPRHPRHGAPVGRGGRRPSRGHAGRARRPRRGGRRP